MEVEKNHYEEDNQNQKDKYSMYSFICGNQPLTK